MPPGVRGEPIIPGRRKPEAMQIADVKSAAKTAISSSYGRGRARFKEDLARGSDATRGPRRTHNPGPAQTRSDEKGPWRENPRRVGSVHASQSLCGLTLWSPGSQLNDLCSEKKGMRGESLFRKALVAERERTLEGKGSPRGQRPRRAGNTADLGNGFQRGVRP